MLRRLVGLYFANAPELLGAMRSAVARGDAEGLRQAAHSLKSTSATLGALRLSELCRAAEEIASAGATVAAGFSLDTIEAEYARGRAALEAELERNA